VDGRYVVVQLKERAKPDDRDFAANQEKLKSALLQARKNDAIQSWLEGTKAAMMKEEKLKIKKDIKDL
jgi:peptidyl-prolyl cis-trans isomerase D